MKSKQERSDIFKLFQASIKKRDSFDVAKQNFLVLREALSAMHEHIFTVCNDEDFCKMPLSTDKTIAYYLYHLTRIEDITSNALIAGKEQLFFTKGFDASLKSPIITTGNEIPRDGIVEFSKKLDIGQLKSYATAVMANTNEIVKNMSFEDSKTKISTERKAKLIKSGTVSTDENAFWLVNYWCGKTYAGLMLMPFSRHHMLHLNGCLRIIDKIKKV
ncbi:MAG: phage head-tail adapter protein [Defluviitaleaceae bacterium]|nr:phage head-tail adapter protein [Defluviitaleaceae bacterium]